MKKLFYLCLPLLLMVSCKQEVTEFSSFQPNGSKKTMPSEEVVGEELIPYEVDSVEYMEYIRECIDSNRHLLGEKLMVFDSYEQMYQTLASLQDFGFWELRTWTAENNWTNHAIEANIIFDSIFYEVAYPFGIEFDNNGVLLEDTEEDEDVLDIVSAEAMEIALGMYPDYFVWETINDTDYIDLVGDIDESIFYNDQNLFIVEGMVHKSFADDGVLICPADLYLQNIIEGEALNVYETLMSIATPEQAQRITLKNSYYNKTLSATVNDGKYQTTVYFRADEYTLFFYVKYYGLVNIKNRRYNRIFRCYMTDRCRTQLDLVIHARNYYRDFVFEFHKNKKFGTKTWRDNIYTRTYSDCYIQSYNLHLSTSRGVVINSAE